VILGLRRRAVLVPLAILLAGPSIRAARDGSPLRPKDALNEREIVERGLVSVRLDPKWGARPDECDALAVSDLVVSVGRRAAKVNAVERLPRPLRHWLIVDNSESAEDRREEAKRSAAQYVREVMVPGLDVASVLTVDEDPILVAGPSDDPADLARRIEALPPGGWSALRDGLDHVLRQIEGDRHEHLIVFWTDGEDQSSLVGGEELLRTLARAPNATVFPIALLPSGSKFPPPPLTGATFTEVARRSGGEVFMSSDPRWLDRVRGWIGRRFTIAFTPPNEAADDTRGLRGLEISLRSKRCQLTLLPDPFARPDPIAGAAPPAPGAWLVQHDASKRADHAACRTEPGVPSWNWPLRAAPGELTGCVLDLVRSPGPIARETDGMRAFALQSARFVSREIRVLAPDLARLPSDAAEAVDTAVASLGDDPTAPSPIFMEGNALLAQRAQIATSLFATRPDYRDFALSRLQRMAAEELHLIEREFTRAFPDLPGDRIAAIARDSRAGRRVVESGQTPTDADLTRVLAAWIRDVPATDLLRELEARLIDLRLRNGADGALALRWSRVGERFSRPTRLRIAAPLVLIRDPAQDVVGFVRVVWPRPERYRPRDGESPEVRYAIDGRLPMRPFALELIDAAASRPGVGEALASRGYRTVSITAEPLDPLERRRPMQPYMQAHVVVTLAAIPAASGTEARAVLEANVTAVDEGPASVTGLRARVTGDPALASLLGD